LWEVYNTRRKGLRRTNMPVHSFRARSTQQASTPGSARNRARPAQSQLLRMRRNLCPTPARSHYEPHRSLAKAWAEFRPRLRPKVRPEPEMGDRVAVREFVTPQAP